MFAVVKAGGSQYKVEPDQIIKIEKVEGKPGEEVVFTNIIAVEKMGDLKIGQPYVKKAKVTGEILEQGKGKKIEVFRYKPKKRVRVKTGHRQAFTKVKVKEIVVS